MINILEHELVPKHEVLSKDEKEEVLKRYNTTEDKLPKILSTDPVVKKIGAKPGDLIKITRKSEVAGEVVYYRLVVGKEKIEEIVEPEEAGAEKEEEEVPTELEEVESETEEETEEAVI